MSSLNSRLQLSLLNRKGSRNLLEKGFTLVELMIVIVIVGILSAVALPNFLSQSAKAKITEPLGKVSAGLKQAQSLWVEKGTFASVTCAQIGFTADDAGAFIENNWTYVCDPTDNGDSMTLSATGIDSTPTAKLGISNCKIVGSTGIITACTKDTDAST